MSFRKNSRPEHHDVMRSSFLTRLKALVVCALSISSLAACQKVEGTAPISSASPRFSMNSNQKYPQGSLTGRIFNPDPLQQRGFREAVAGFLSTDLPPQYIGDVSATGVGNSGVFFGGRISIVGGSLRQYLASTTVNYAEIQPSGSLVVQVYDSNPQYSNVPPIPAIQFNQVRGRIMGNQAQIVFSDTYGSITLEGILNTSSATFEGVASYDNNVRYDGSTPGAAGTFGNFSIPMCSLFVCQ